MKALSLIQPWATLVAIGAKRIETRTWATGYRGPLAIHASKWRTDAGGIVSKDVREFLSRCFQEPFCSALTRAGYNAPGELPSGAIVATARLVDVKPTHLATLRIDAYEREFGNYGPGRYAWCLDNVHQLPAPIPYRGERGLWWLPDEALAVQTSALTREH